jgi:beta-glucosidase-like glycosyl hydrolase
VFFLLACSQKSSNVEIPEEELILTDPQALTENDLEQLKRYADTCEIEDAVGQLFMVGLPTDIVLHTNDKVIEKIISEFNIGWVFINTHNYWWSEKYPLKNDVLSNIANFYNKIQDKAIETGLRIPVGFSANFEGGNYSSIGRILSQPPEALTIAASNNGEIASKVGSLVGHQLRQLGIHILLGPVFDVDSTSAREFVTRTQNRIFAGTPDLVTNIASHYFNGLKKNRIIIIAKHFPGYGDVSENPHNNEMPESRDSFEALESNLIPYKSLEPNIDGVMTAHMSINILDPIRSKVVTFSPVIVNDLYRKNEKIEILENKTLDGLNYGDKVAVTDDLADMGAIRKYMKSNDFNWDDIVVQAFDAGHDILLFSIIEKDKNALKKSDGFSRFKDFDIAQLDEILKKFIVYIKSSKVNEERFRISLYRSLILKAKIAKLYDQSVHDFLNSVGMERWRLGAIKEDTLKSIPISDPEAVAIFEDADSIIDDTLKAGYLEINKAAGWNLKNAPANLNISFFTDRSIDDNDEELLKHNFSNVTFYKLSRQKTQEQYMGIYRQLVLSLESSDKIYFTVSTQDDANLIKSAYEQHRSLVQQKLVILIHNTPTLIESNILQGVTVIGCFSTIFPSYVTDLDVILGRTEIKPLHYLTISLGSNGSVYDHKKSDFSFALSSPRYKLLPYYATAKEKVLTEENKRLAEEFETLKNDFHSMSYEWNEKEIKSKMTIISLFIFIILVMFSPQLKQLNRNGVLCSFLPEKFMTALEKIYNSKIIRGGVILVMLSSLIIWYLFDTRMDNISWPCDIMSASNFFIVTLIILFVIVWYILGKDFTSAGKEPSNVSTTILCVVYRHPIIFFLIVIFVILLLLFNFQDIVQDIISIFKKNG